MAACAGAVVGASGDASTAAGATVRVAAATAAMLGMPHNVCLGWRGTDLLPWLGLEGDHKEEVGFTKCKAMSMPHG